MQKLLITNLLPPRTLDVLRAAFDVTIREAEGDMTKDEAADALRNFDLILPSIGDPFVRDVFEAVDAPRCGILANFGVGYNHIDVVAAAEAGIVVTNTPGAVTEATADIAMTLLLSVARRTNEGERLLRQGKWTGWTPVQMLGTHVSGKRVAILGLGRIGQAVAARCHFGFGMQISYFSRSEKTDLAFPATFRPTVHEAVQDADFVVVTAAGGPETLHLVNADVLRAMPKGSYLINVARGTLVDEAALVAALQAGEIAGAGLDVYEQEPVVTPELIDMENTVLVPHLGTAALEVRENMGQMAADNLIAFKNGETPPNRIDPTSV